MLNVGKRTVFHGDNLPIMEGINSGTIDCIYADPPFLTQRDHHQRKNQKIRFAFSDKWDQPSIDDLRWLEDQITDPKVLTSLSVKDNKRNLELFDIIKISGYHSKGLRAYILYMCRRLLEMKRILKPKGAIYIHCDQKTSHYLKVVMDSIFGKSKFKEIVWQRHKGAHNALYGAIHDTLLYYGDGKIQEEAREKHSPEQIQRNYKHVDEKGRYSVDTHLLYRIADKHDPSNELHQPWRGVEAKLTTGALSSWVVVKDNLTGKWIEDNHIPNFTNIDSVHKRLDLLDEHGFIYWSKDGRPYFKQYLFEGYGRLPQSLWLDINAVIGNSGQATGYPTQKPEALLRRIIKASVPRGGIILDPFCGSGTTIYAALTLGRGCIAIDNSELAIETIKEVFQQKIYEDIIFRNDIPIRGDLE